MLATLTAPPPRRAALRQGTGNHTPFSQALPWLLGSIAMTMTALVGQVPFWALAAFTCCVVWRYLIERRQWRLPTFAARLLVFVPMTLAVIRTYGAHPSAPGMLTFLVALMSLKVLELRSPRDFTVVGLLGYFMTLSAFFYSQSLLICLYLGIALLANTVALIRAHSGNGQSHARESFRLAAIMIVQSLPLVLVLFLVFPRVQGSFLRRLGGDPQGLTGMSEHLQPGSFGSLASSSETAFRAKIITTGPLLTTSQLYWRGLVMETCEQGLSWRASDSPPDRGPHNLPPETRRLEQQITMIPQRERWMFALDHPSDIKTGTDIHAGLTATNVLKSTAPLVSKTIYTAISQITPLWPQELSPADRKRDTYLPEDIGPRSLALADGWKKKAKNDDEILRMALEFFRDGHFSYTLNPGVLPAKTGLDTFLFSKRAGFCEHYAAAFCTLMRAAGLPARVVVGYQGGEYNSWGGHYLVRQSDAHAWSEVWLEGRGWQRVDPTGVVAPDRVSFGADDYSTLMSDGPLTEESRLARLRRIKAPSTLRWIAHNALLAWDGVDQQWNLLVLGYDQEQQWVFLQKLGVGDLSWVGGTTLTLVTVFTLLAIGVLGFRISDGRGAKGSIDQERRLYAKFCRRLLRAGAPAKEPGEGPLDYARRAGGALPTVAPDIRRITDLYVGLRYGRPAVPNAVSERSRQFRAAVMAFRPVRTQG